MPGPPYPDVNVGTPQHGPRYGSGDFFDNRGQFLKQLKRDKGAPWQVDDVSDGIPLITRGKSFLWGQIDGENGLRDNSIDGTSKIRYQSIDITRLLKGTTFTVLMSGALNPIWSLIVNANVDPAAAIAYSKLALANSIVNADIAAAAAINLAKLEAGATALAAPMACGTPLGSTDQLDMATIATANTTYAGGTLPMDMSTDARTLQVKLVSGFRVTGWGASTGISGSVTLSRITNGAGSGVVVVRTNNHNMTPGAHPAPNMQMVDSGWANMGNEAAQAWNINSTFNFTAARPTGQIWIQAFMQGV